MKFFLITFMGTLITVGAHQSLAADKPVLATRKDSWEEIRKDKDLFVAQPDFVKDMGPDGIFNVCSTATDFRSIEPVGTCLDYKMIETAPESTEFGLFPEYHCQQEAPGEVIVSRLSTQEVCQKSATMETEDKNATCLKSVEEGLLPTTVTLDVLKRRGENKGQSVFVKDYQIPECSNF